MSLEFAKVFNFLHADTFFHRLDPRSKFAMLVNFSVLAFLYRDLGLMIASFVICLPFLYAAHIAGRFFKGLGGMSFLIFFILIFNSYFQSVNFALIIIMRIIILMVVFSIYFQTTPPEDLTQALYLMKMSYPTAFSFSLAFRFVPTMARETQIVMDAQRSRGHQIQEGGMLQQIKNLFPLLIPLIMNSIRRAMNVAEALQTRAFGAQPHPSFYYPLQFRKNDLFFIIGNLGILILGLLLYFIPTLFPLLRFNLTF